MFVGDLANLQGNEVRTLGQQQRRAPLLRVVLERHGIVRRVGNDDIGFGDRSHHPALRSFALELADTLLDLRLTFAVLVLVAHFLLGHEHFLVRLPQLDRYVRRRNQQQAGRHPQRTPTHHLHAVNDCLFQRLVGNRQQVITVGREHDQGNDQNHQELGKCLEQLGQGIDREHPLDAGKRVHSTELGLQQATGKQKTAQRHRPDDRCHEQHQEHRLDSQQSRLAGCHEKNTHEPLIDDDLTRQDEVAAHQLHQGLGHATPKSQQGTRSGQGHRYGVELFGARNLTLFPRVFFALVGGVFCFVLTAFALCHAQRARASSRIHCKASEASAW